jgi:hypothetical protein
MIRQLVDAEDEAGGHACFSALKPPVDAAIQMSRIQWAHENVQ